MLLANPLHHDGPNPSDEFVRGAFMVDAFERHDINVAEQRLLATRGLDEPRRVLSIS